MKAWVFNEDQLKAALDAWRKKRGGSYMDPLDHLMIGYIEAFLKSPEAQKLRLKTELPE